MKISTNYSYNYNINSYKHPIKPSCEYLQDQDVFDKVINPSFQANPITAVKDYLNFIRAKRSVKYLTELTNNHPRGDKLLFRNVSMEFIEGIQYGIDVFKGLSMKDIQYLSENLHVIAVKRGCNNMCGYCYADAKPSNREMSWEDFTSITYGFKKLQSRLPGFSLFGENMLGDNPDNIIYKSTELFYDADCMALSIKDKKGNEYDYRDLVTELYEGLGRHSVFDTSGWVPENIKMQKRAEDYAEYFSKPENMDKLNQFNLSFNVFSASNIASIRALRAGDIQRAKKLEEKFTDRIANAIYTFTPLLNNKKFSIMQRAFGFNAKNAEGFDIARMSELTHKVTKKVQSLYEKDLNTSQKYIKTKDDIERNMKLLSKKLERIQTGLNSSGRMKEFMSSFGIKSPMQDHSESTKVMFKDLQEHGRYHRYLAHKLIDTDGRVYHMDYARFFPTEIQLNLKNKQATPPLANLREDCLVSKEMINKSEYRGSIDEFV